MNLLSKLLILKKSVDDKPAVKFLTSISPIASQHFNLSGLYEFSEDRAEIDVDAVVAIMEEILDTTVENLSGQIKSKTSVTS